jgi:hypothetical protein
VGVALLLRILKHAGPNPGSGTEYPEKKNVVADGKRQDRGRA